MGSCIRPGTPLICCLVCSWIMPAKASDPPDGISTVVSARRVLIDGMVSDWFEPGTDKVKALSVDRSDTSVITFRLMRPSDRTTGVKTRLTPNFLKSTCAWQTGGDFVVSQDKPFGIGNSPPATKLAVSPEIAVKFGSASVRRTPARSIARSVAVTFCDDPLSEVLLSGWPVAEKEFCVLRFNTAV